MNTINVENCKTLLIGRRGENEVTTVAFDFTEWASEFGSGVVDLYVKRFGDDSAYPVVLTIDGTIATWTVTATDTNVAGYGKAEYVYRVDGKIAKSAVFPFFVAEDIGQPASEPPDPYESWLEQLTALGAETEAHAQAAEQSAEDAAESAQQAAESAASIEGAVEQAEAARDAARAAQAASEAARDAAQTAQASAESSATAASGSADSSAGSATAAAGSASDASASATAAGASATAAGNAATQAESAKTAAQTAQSAAEDAAEDAQQAAQQAHVEYEQLSGEVDDLSDEVSQQKSAIEALEDLANRKAGMLVDSASGAIASFVPDSTIPDLLGVTVDIEPVQDLHGFDHPWPAGGGVNKLDPSVLNDSTSWQYVILNGFVAGASYTMSSPDAPSHSDINAPRMFFVTSNPAQATTAVYSNHPITDIANENGELKLQFQTRNASYPLTSYHFQIESGSTATSYAPFENICPISGRDSVEVEATGKNLFDASNLESVSVSVDGAIKSKFGHVFKKPGKYALKTYAIGTSSYLYAKVHKADGTWSNDYYLVTATSTTAYIIDLTIGNELYVYDVQNHTEADVSASFTSWKMQVAYADTQPTDYEPYTGTTYAIPLGQTVYGAKLTIAEDGSVTALVDRAKIVFDGTQAVGPVNWRPNSQSVGWLYRSETVPGISLSDTAHVMSDTLPTVDFETMWTGTFACISNVPGDLWGLAMRVNDTTLTTEAAINAYLAAHPVTVIYQLATPIEITLDPVAVAAIANQTNNVWADAGDVSVTYAADVKTYIDQKIAAAVAALS